MKRIQMRWSLLLLPALWYLTVCSAPAHEAPAGKKLIRDYVFIPAGADGDSLISEFYISAIEVTNKQYRDFLSDLIDSGATEQLQLAMVDTLQWGRICPACVHHYFQQPAYDDYPVLDISKRAAELYCDWLTLQYNKASKQKVRFSLPTELQWEYAAKGGYPKSIYPWPGNALAYEKKGKLHSSVMCNYQVDTIKSIHTVQNDSAAITAPVRSYLPNTYEIYNMGGNVAEMVADQDYTKGGSYLSHADKILISAHEDADLSHGHPTIGFRPVMVYETVK
jgi:formylglycine-generating enzyme required for sulfatase activity